MTAQILSMEAASADHQAALLLHALADPDRAWLLARLPAANASTLRAMLEELQVLGIPRDTSLVEQAIAPLAGDSLAAAPIEPLIESKAGSSGLTLDELNAEHCRMLAELLRDEPADLVAMLLASQAWDWESVFLSALPAPKSTQVKQRLQILRKGHMPLRQAMAIRQAAELAIQATMQASGPGAALPTRAAEAILGGRQVARQKPWWQRLRPSFFR